MRNSRASVVTLDKENQENRRAKQSKQAFKICVDKVYAEGENEQQKQASVRQSVTKCIRDSVQTKKQTRALQPRNNNRQALRAMR
jgi:hypothetical protein